MSKISEKVAYARGLMEGLALDPRLEETKLFNALLGVLETISEAYDELDDRVIDLEDDLDDVSDALDDLLEDAYGEDEDDTTRTMRTKGTSN
jgi:hypothetical protein